MFLEGKTALVTGSTSGIGLAIARALAGEGAQLVLNGFGNEGEIAQLCEEMGATHSAADLTDAAQIETMMGEAGPVDILINNAGMQHVSPVEDFPAAMWDKLIALNLTAAFHTTRLAVPGMKEKGWGRIISTASAHSKVASPFKSAYNASKHGIAGFTKTIALELAEHGITANCISPGYVWTPLIEGPDPRHDESARNDPRRSHQRRAAGKAGHQEVRPARRSRRAGRLPLPRRSAKCERRELEHRWRLDGGVNSALHPRVEPR